MFDSTVSVIIPVFNGASFIAQAISSALDQHHSPLEIIVVDDGSTDATPTILETFSEKVTVITIANGGVANARNVGIKAARGALIAFLDADDIWAADKLELQVAALARYPEVGLCCCDFVVQNGPGCPSSNHFARFRNEPGIVFDVPLGPDAFVLLLRQNFIGTCSNVILRRAVLERTGLFDAGYRQAEDYDLWLRCAQVTEIMVVGAALLEKRRHDANLTGDFLDTLLWHERVLLQIERERPSLVGKAWPVHTLHEALAGVRYQIGNLQFERGNRCMAFGCFFDALRARGSIKNFRQFVRHVMRKTARLLLPMALRRRHF